MEAPLAIFETPKPNMNFQNKKSFKLEADNAKYTLSLSYNDKLIFFEIEKDGEFPKKEYNLILDLDQLYKINKYFVQFENFADIQTSFEALIEMKKLTVLKNEDEKGIKINIINPLNKKEFFIEIPLKEKTLKNEIDSIIPYIVSLNDKINKMENRINILENKVNELYSIKEEYSKLKKENMEENSSSFSKSSIITSKDENTILSWFDRKPSNFNLLLDSKIDGDLTSTFYQKCKNKCPTILFFKTSNGARFGGFTTQFWPENGSNEDKKSFVFSLDKKEKYKVTNSKYSLYGVKDYFQFGACCFRIYNKCTSVNTNYINDDKYCYDIPSNYGLTGGDRNFIISSYEVYQVEY